MEGFFATTTEANRATLSVRAQALKKFLHVHDRARSDEESQSDDGVDDALVLVGFRQSVGRKQEVK